MNDTCTVCNEPVEEDTYMHAYPDGGGLHHVVREPSRDERELGSTADSV